MTVATLTEHRPAVALFGLLVRRLCWPPIGDPSLSLDGALSLGAMERKAASSVRHCGATVTT